MFCPYCGRQTAEGTRFCTVCGTSLVEAGPPPIPAQGRTQNNQYGYAPKPMAQNTMRISFNKSNNFFITISVSIIMAICALLSWVKVGSGSGSGSVSDAGDLISGFGFKNADNAIKALVYDTLPDSAKTILTIISVLIIISIILIAIFCFKLFTNYADSTKWGNYAVNSMIGTVG